MKKHLLIFFSINIFFFFFITNNIGYFEAPDSIAHFRRSIELSIPKTKLVSTKLNNKIKGLSPTPKALVIAENIHKDNWELQLKTNLRKKEGLEKLKPLQKQIKDILMSDKIKNVFNEINTSEETSATTLTSYSGMNYLPQILAIKFANFLNLNLDITYNFARNSNKVLLFLIIAYCTKLVNENILITPLYCLFYISLPTSLFLFSSISGDPGIIAGIIYLTILIDKHSHNSYLQQSKNKNSKIIFELFFAIIALAAVMSKSAYLPLGIVLGFVYLFYLNKNNFRSIKYIFFTSFSLTSYLCIKWINYVSESAIEFFRLVNPSINPELALLQVKTFSFTFIKAIFQTTFKELFFWIRQAIGVFGPVNNKWLMPEFLYWIIFLISFFILIKPILLILSSKINTLKFHSLSQILTKFSPVLSITLALGLSLYLLFGSLWTVWTPSGSEIVWGIQGRYFIPYLPICILLLSLLITEIRSLSRINIQFFNKRVLLIGILFNLLFFYINIYYYY